MRKRPNITNIILETALDYWKRQNIEERKILFLRFSSFFGN